MHKNEPTRAVPGSTNQFCFFHVKSPRHTQERVKKDPLRIGYDAKFGKNPMIRVNTTAPRTTPRMNVTKPNKNRTARKAASPAEIRDATDIHIYVIVDESDDTYVSINS